MSWEGLPFTDMDGKHWPLAFAAALLEVPEEDLRDLVRIFNVEPSGTMRMNDFRRQGRQPRCYQASTLIIITEGVRKISVELADKKPDPCDDGGEART